MEIRNLTKKLPYPIRQSLKYIYGAILPIPIRYGKLFRDTYKFLQESQWWSKEMLEDYQLQHLSKLLHHAYENVPYYRRIFNERGLKPKDIQSFDDLRKLPYLTKDLIRENLPDLIAANYPKHKLEYVTTGGSTGIPMGLYWERDVTTPKEWAFVWRQWNWAGYRFRDKRATLRGNIISRYKDDTQQWWEYLPVDNVLLLSSYNMTDKNLPKYIEKINQFKPIAIQGYPSSLYVLANFLRNRNLSSKNIKCILTSSETLYPHQKEVIEKYFEAKNWDLYGNTERSALVMQCKKESYHIISEYGIVELIDKNGEVVTKEGESGEIVATGFNNYAMPLIRYRSGDIAIYSAQKCSCGRHFPLLKSIEGRLQEFVVTKNGDLIPLGPAIFGIHDTEWTKVKQVQFQQEEKGKLIINIVKDQSSSDIEIKEYVLKLLSARLKGQFELKAKIVDDIPRTERGKYRYLIQKLPIKISE